MNIYQFSDGKETRWIAAPMKKPAIRVANCLGWRSTSKEAIFTDHRVPELIANGGCDIVIYRS